MHISSFLRSSCVDRTIVILGLFPDTGGKKVSPFLWCSTFLPVRTSQQLQFEDNVSLNQNFYELDQLTALALHLVLLRLSTWMNFFLGVQNATLKLYSLVKFIKNTGIFHKPRNPEMRGSKGWLRSQLTLKEGREMVTVTGGHVRVTWSTREIL